MLRQSRADWPVVLASWVLLACALGLLAAGTLYTDAVTLAGLHRELRSALPILTAAENVEVPLRLVGAEPRERDRRVAALLDLVGLEARARHRPHELSGGEQQRVAIARALANRPKLLLADEPTGQLDSETGRRIMLLIRTVVRAEGVTAVVATHDPVMLDVADRVIELLDGRLTTPDAVVPGEGASPGPSAPVG